MTSGTDPRRDDTAAHYDRVAQAWRIVMGDSLHYGRFASAHESLAAATTNLTRSLAEGAAIARGHRLLDVGCGIGGPALELVKTYGCEVRGISTSAVGVALATQQAGDAGLAEQASFRVADALAMPFDAASFDRVWLLESAHLIEPKRTLFAECARVLRPGGRLALCDIVRLTAADLQQLYRQARDFNLLDQVFGRARVDTLAHYTALLADAGLTMDRVEDISQAVVPTFDRWRANIEAQEAALDVLIGSSARQAFAEACAVLQRLWREGTLGYGCLWATRRA